MQTFTQVGISKHFYEVFDDADIGDSVTWIIQKKKNTKQDVLLQLCKSKEDAMTFPSSTPYSSILNDADKSYNLSAGALDFIKFNINSSPLVDITKITVGVKAYQTGKGVPKQTKEIVKEKIFTSNHKIDDTYIQCVVGKDFHRYQFLQKPAMYLSYGKWLAEPRNSAPFFDDEKIIIRQTSDSLIGTIDNKQRVNLNNVYNIGVKDSDVNLKFILGLLNSKLLNFIYQNISQEKGRTFAEVKKTYLAKLPIKNCDSVTQEKISYLVNSIIASSENLQILSQQFISLLISKYDNENFKRSLFNWFDTEFSDFLKELRKSKVKLTLSEEAEWMQYFNEQKERAQNLKAEIDKTDNAIDQLVYQLYGLTEEEIEIVENV